MSEAFIVAAKIRVTSLHVTKKKIVNCWGGGGYISRAYDQTSTLLVNTFFLKEINKKRSILIIRNVFFAHLKCILVLKIVFIRRAVHTAINIVKSDTASKQISFVKRCILSNCYLNLHIYSIKAPH